TILQRLCDRFFLARRGRLRAVVGPTHRGGGMARSTGNVRIRALALALVATAVLVTAVGAASAAPTHRSAAKAVTLTFGANAVVGGKNDLEASWFTNYIVPNFE